MDPLLSYHENSSQALSWVAQAEADSVSMAMAMVVVAAEVEAPEGGNGFANKEALLKASQRRSPHSISATQRAKY